MKIITSAIIQLIVFCGLIHALGPEKNIKKYLFKNWQYEEGLPNNTITSITQTSDGYIWLGSKQGVIRFDGVKFKEYSSENYPEFANDNVWAVFGDSKNNLWIGTDGGGLLKFSNGKFQKFTTQNGLADNVVWSINEDSKGNIWIGTGGGGISKLSDGKFTTINSVGGLSSDYVWCVYPDKNGNIWAGTDGDGLNKISNGKITVLSPSNEFPSDYIFSSTEDNSGNIYFGTIDGIVVKTKNGYSQYTTKHGLLSDAIWSLLTDKDNNIWIGTDGGGISKFYKGKIESFSVEEGLQSNFVSSILQDSEGNIWVGTKGGGINRFKEGLINTLTYKANELPNDYVFCAFEDSDKNLWFGTYGGVSLKKNDSYRKFTTEDGLTSPLVLAITEDKSGNIWIGTDGGGLNLFKNNKFSVFNTSHGLTSNSIWALHSDKQNNLWIGTDGGGLNVYRNGKFFSYDSSDGISSEFVSSIIEDKSGKIWIGTQDLGVFIFEKNEFKPLSVKSGLPSDVIWSIYEDDSCNVWIATNGGLCRIKKNKVFSYNVDDGLFSNKIYSVIEDDYKNLWMSCDKGIFKVEKKLFDEFDNGKINNISYVNFGISDGMNAAECSNGSPASLKSSDGKLWFPTIKGAAYLDPREISSNGVLPLVYIENVSADLIDYSLESEINIPPGEGRVEIDFTALNFSSPERILFKYKLEGYDNNWINAGYARSATYTNLSPGIYSFSVIASSNGTSWNYNQPTSIKFSILPHFWQIWWFKTFLTIFFVILLGSFYLYRMYSTNKKNKILAKLVKERTFELENEVIVRKEKEAALRESEENLKKLNASKDKLFAIISHDLRSPFQGILGYANILKDELENLSRDELKKIVLNINRLAKIYSQLLNNLLEWSRLQKGALEFNPQLLNLTELINKVIVLFYENAISKDISLRTELTHNLIIYADENMISSVIQNLISNALKFTKNKGVVTVSTFGKNNKIIISVADNGVGMEKQLLDKLFNIGEQVTKVGTADEKGSGLGLIICNELIEKNNGKISVESAPGKGSTFSIEFPLPDKNLNLGGDKARLKVFDIKKAQSM